MATHSGQFQPGQSGNPGGAPRKGESLREVLRAHITPTKKKRIAAKLYAMAMEGDVRALALLYDNHDGKLPTQIGGVIDEDGAERSIPLRIITE